MCVAMVTIFVKFLLPWQPSQGILFFFEMKISNLKTTFYNPQSFRTIWNKFTLRNNSLVWHRLLVTHV